MSRDYRGQTRRAQHTMALDSRCGVREARQTPRQEDIKTKG